MPPFRNWEKFIPAISQFLFFDDNNGVCSLISILYIDNYYLEQEYMIHIFFIFWGGVTNNYLLFMADTANITGISHICFKKELSWPYLPAGGHTLG